MYEGLDAWLLQPDRQLFTLLFTCVVYSACSWPLALFTIIICSLSSVRLPSTILSGTLSGSSMYSCITCENNIFQCVLTVLKHIFLNNFLLFLSYIGYTYSIILPTGLGFITQWIQLLHTVVHFITWTQSEAQPMMK